jgi:DNA-binding HxlR family transcriptional regulator
MDTAPRSGCAINAAVEVLGDPWAMLVLRDIMFGNRRHFRELIAGSEEGIATNILASRLKQLVAAGLLARDAARRGQRAAYSLTEAGIPRRTWENCRQTCSGFTNGHLCDLGFVVGWGRLNSRPLRPERAASPFCAGPPGRTRCTLW